MSAEDLGVIDWGLSRDEDGHRNYNVTHLVESSDPDDDPSIIINCPGLPTIGSTYNYGNGGDSWAFCQPHWKVSPVVTNEPNCLFKVEIPFSTRPMRRCQDESIENPINEPPRIWGSFSKFVEQISKDRFGKVLRNSAWEPLTGPECEFDKNRPSVCIELNSLTLPLYTIAPIIDTVNDAPLWGLDARMIKLSNFQWKRLLYGTCTFYYALLYEFDIDFKTFDRKVPDLGTRFFLGLDENYADHKHDPKWYVAAADLPGNLMVVSLNGAGKLWVPVDEDDPQPMIDIEYYDESNFPALGVPTSF